LAPSLLSMTAVEQLAIPERLSVPVKVTVTFVLFQPAALACGATAAWTVGGVLSILIVGEVYVALLPATSVTVTAPATAAPSVASDNGLGTDVEATPERTSEEVKPIATLLLFHPAAFAAGTADPNVTTGGVLSIFTGGDVNVAVLPARSVIVTTPLTDDPSAVTDKGLGTEVEAIPERLSAVVKLKATLVLFQAAAFGAGDAAPNASVGAVLSILMPVREDGGLVLPALSVQVPDAD